jgi:aryl-alcohol dehydrogenase-like predicted oxidoreductase
MLDSETLMPRGASAEATAAYAGRFDGRIAAGSSRHALGLTVSSLGLGTYLGRDDDAADRNYREAIVAAVEAGINVIDTAVNYRLERSERAIGHALADLAARGFRREEIVVATKGGYIPSHDPETYFAKRIVGPGHARPEDLVAGCHCLAPGYLREQLRTSLENMGLESVDFYYLHNPEQQLDALDHDAFLSRLRDAFGFLEEAVTEGKVGFYGTATWNGYRVPLGSPGALSLEAVFQAARDVGGEDHHFRVVQLPFNLAMPEAYAHTTQKVAGREVPLLEAAEHFGVTVMTSASILQGRLSRGLPEALHEALPGLASDALRAIQFARSAPGVTTALVGMGQPAHARQNAEILRVEPLRPDRFATLFRGN